MRLSLAVRGRRSIRSLRRSIDRRRRGGDRGDSSQGVATVLHRASQLPAELREKIFVDFLLLQSIREICSPANSRRVFLAALAVSQTPAHRPGQSFADLICYMILRNEIQLLRCALEHSPIDDVSLVLRITNRIEISLDRLSLRRFTEELPSASLILWYEYIVDNFSRFSLTKARRGVLFDLAAHVLGALVSNDLAVTLRPVLKKAVHCDSLMNSIMEHNRVGSSWLEIVLHLVGCRWSVEAMTALLTEVLGLEGSRLRELMGDATFEFLQNADINGIVELLLQNL